LKKTVVILAATTLAVSLAPVFQSARGQDPILIPQAHCQSTGVTCATCATGSGLIYCANPLPQGYTWSDCQQGGNGCWQYNNWYCGAQSDCATYKFNGNQCIGPISICM
jgi:hypothetical protein